jgi:medium-chain acyl-[acyl-carrier-protein] hydrolase
MQRWLSRFRESMLAERADFRYLCWHLEKGAARRPSTPTIAPGASPSVISASVALPPPVDARRCFAFGEPQRDARLLLLALPHAGGRAASFLEYATLDEERVQWCPLDLPDREAIETDVTPRRIEALVDSLGPLLEPHLDRRFALLGHSLGGCIAYELGCWLEQRGRKPAFLTVMASHVPDSPIGMLLQELMNSCAFDAVDTPLLLGMLGGTPPDVLGAEPLLARALPAITRDFELALRYRRSSPVRLAAPIHAVTGDADRIVPPSLAHGWSRFTTSSFTAHVIPGAGHFLLKTHGGAIRSWLSETLSAVTMGQRRES